MHIVSKTGHILFDFEPLLWPLLKWKHKKWHQFIKLIFHPSPNLSTDLWLVTCICKIVYVSYLKIAGQLNARKTWKNSLGPRPPGDPYTMPTLNLIPDSYLGGKIVQDTCVTFDATIPNMVTMMPQSWIKYDQFFKQYATRSLQPIWIFSVTPQKTKHSSNY